MKISDLNEVYSNVIETIDLGVEGDLLRDVDLYLSRERERRP